MEIGGKKDWRVLMDEFFFSGLTYAKLDEKNRFVLPQAMRYGLVEAGKLEFTLSLGLGGSLAIYRKSEIKEIVAKFRAKLHHVKFQKFLTLFFSTLHTTTCDKVGRVLLPSVLKKAAGIKDEIVIAGVLDKIEIWPKEKYEFDLEQLLSGDADNSIHQLAEEAFACLGETQEENKKNLTEDIEQELHFEQLNN